jgi:hypothetical protein
MEWCLTKHSDRFTFNLLMLYNVVGSLQESFQPFLYTGNYFQSRNILSDFIIFHSIRDSAVGIATGYGLDDRVVGVRVPVGSIIFSTASRPALRPTQPPIQWVTGALSSGIKRPRREADHSL